MIDEAAREHILEVSSRHGGKALFDEPLKEHSTIRIGGSAECLYMPETTEELSELVIFLKDNDIRTAVLGNGSNVLLPDAGVEGVVINPGSGEFSVLDCEGAQVTASSGVHLSRLIYDSCSHGLSGLEGLVGIPGTVGGALATNASYKTAVSDTLLGVRVMDADGKAAWIDKERIDFGYRSSSLVPGNIVLGATFRLGEDDPDVIRGRIRDNFLDKMENQPIGRRTLGCIFRNPGSGQRVSWELIDLSGMRGRSRGGAKVSEKHANFIENTGGATSQETAELIEEVRSAVREKFSIDLVPEIEIW